jgi:hypothetical protein
MLQLPGTQELNSGGGKATKLINESAQLVEQRPLETGG